MTLALEQGDDNGLTANNVIATGGTWYHVAGTWDGTTERIFVNGSEVANGTWAGSVTPDSRSIYLGGRAGADYGNDCLDEDANTDGALPGDSGRAGADLLLYKDGGDNQPTGGDDTPRGTSTSDANGDCIFAGLADGTYWVVADAATFRATAYNGGFGPADVWAEQT